MPDISPNVVILTREELREREQRAFIRGVERGKFEASCEGRNQKVARNCGNWRHTQGQIGICDICGAQHHGCEIGADFACPGFTPRT